MQAYRLQALQQPITISLYLWNSEFAWFTDGLELASRQILKTVVTFDIELGS